MKGRTGPTLRLWARRLLRGVRGRSFPINGLRADLGLTGLTGRRWQGFPCAREGTGNDGEGWLLMRRSDFQALQARPAHFCT
jgi:hypothetical protein